MSKQALLVVSFGTTFVSSRKKSIEQVETELIKCFPNRDFFHAYTSGVIRKKIEKEEGIIIPSVEEAIKEIQRLGYEDVLVQPTHIIDGIENHEMKDVLRDYGKTMNITIGEPLLTSDRDYEICVSAVTEFLRDLLTKDTAVFLMGHGTSHEKNICYEKLGEMFGQAGYNSIYVGTVEALPDLRQLLESIQSYGYKRIVLMPFMLVAGDHAHNDMVGTDENSWKSVLEGEGYAVLPVVTGLGELPKIRSLFITHAMEKQKA